MLRRQESYQKKIVGKENLMGLVKVDGTTNKLQFTRKITHLNLQYWFVFPGLAEKITKVVQSKLSC